MDNTYHYHSTRAREARFKQVLDHGWVQALFVLGLIAGVSLGLYLLIIHQPAGWLLIGLASILLMLLVWTKIELRHIPAGKTENLDDVLSGDVMMLMGKDPTPQDLAPKLIKTQSGRFLAVRFGITADLLEFIAQALPTDMNLIFGRAQQIRGQTGSAQIEGAVMMVALIENFPDYENLLSRMKLELKDLYDGIRWFDFLHGRAKDSKKSRHTGGIARDLAFGYIPTLQYYGHTVGHEKGIKTILHSAAHKEILAKMTQILSSGGRQNVALIGAAGSGRSTIVEAFADELLDADSQTPSNLKFRQIFMLDATSLLAASKGYSGGIEALLNKVFYEAYSAQNIILCLDNAQLFFEEGTGSVDVTNLLLPVLEAGNLRMILMLEEQKFLELTTKNPGLTNAMNRIMVEPSDEAATMDVMKAKVPILEYKYKVLYDYRSLREAYRLSERYVHDLVMPGRALSLLESAANFADNKLVTTASVARAVEQTEGVKVQVASDEGEKQKLLNMEQLIHQRMIDQVEAVQTVSDALRRAAAGVRNQNRPIGTFLFLGPTGVGKTELAKALSEVYFGGEGQMVRLDLNEFVSAADVNRLIADGSEDALSLTAQVMKQPFSVVLLDEIEKAHPQVLTTLLQLLDEGILRDVRNREVSFRDTIVIATSNAGALQIREFISQNAPLAQVKEHLTNELIKSGEFKPEFLNRFDEICVFRPLGKPELLQIVDLILASTNKTLAPQKITVQLDDAAKQLLVERGYDPALGARPMRRIVQQTVENLVARSVLAGQASAGTNLTITADQIQAVLQQ